jgi:hypothetical protein
MGYHNPILPSMKYIPENVFRKGREEGRSYEFFEEEVYVKSKI